MLTPDSAASIAKLRWISGGTLTTKRPLKFRSASGEGTASLFDSMSVTVLATTRRIPDKAASGEYFRRQVYACCWFETITSDAIVDRIGEDNIMFETDFPHPTSIYGDEVQKTIDSSLGTLSQEIRRKLLWDNAAALYEIESPSDEPSGG